MGKKKTSEKEKEPINIPLLAIDNFVMTPMIPTPVKIEKDPQLETLNYCNQHQTHIFITTRIDKFEENNSESIKSIGIIGIIDRVLQMPGAPTLAFVRPIQRGRIVKMNYRPLVPMVSVMALDSVKDPRRKSKEIKFWIERIDDLFKDLMNFMPPPEKETALKLVEENSDSLTHRFYAMASVAPLSWEDKYKIISCDDFDSLMVTLTSVLDETEQKISIQAKIHERTHMELSKQQKDTFLRAHLNQIQIELGEAVESDDVNELLKKAESKKWPDEAKEHFHKELKKMKRLNVNNPEYSVQYSYLEAFLELPWENYKNSEIAIDKVKEILDRDHYGLEKVKERILEYMAVVKLRNDLKAPILCLYGPPGVGKTSVGKSIAEAVDREYRRISLGGLHDEAEIRGHRKTYIGAMPGRFITALAKCEYGNALILLDEIDKVGKDFKGDPSSALLEALDPEQNNTFHDNFIDFPYDLSKVLFIATANDLSSVPAPLLDRMEIIEMPGYKLEEKREIALRHIVKKVLQENGLENIEVTFPGKTIDFIIQNYTKEKGVRQLEKALGRIARKLALMKVKSNKIPEEISTDNVREFLGTKDNYLNSVGFH